MIAWIFPGQGSQSVGMGASLTAEPARETFAQAREVLGWDVGATCRNGPAELLASTEKAQPAILTVSVALARTLEALGLLPHFVAGHSVGEFAALVAARSITFGDALHVVAARADAMARAGRAGGGSMAAVIGLPVETVEEICQNTTGVVTVANANAPDQLVISGEMEPVVAATDAMRRAGARRVIPLAVSVGAHSPLMADATLPLGRALANVHLLSPLIPFVSGVSAGFEDDPATIAKLLVGALTSPVRWTDCVQTLSDAGSTLYVEVGSSRVLSGLVRRILPGGSGASIVSVGDADSAVRLAGYLVQGCHQ